MSRSHAMRPADERELAAVWSAVRAVHAYPSREALMAFWREAPWRVQVSEAGDAAILERWREHLGLLAIKGLWCAERNMDAILADLRSVARSQGFDDVLSPLVPQELTPPYEAAGMRVVHCGVSMRRPRSETSLLSVVPGISVRLAVPADLDILLAADERSFDPFWRYDRRTLSTLLETYRATVATSDGAVIGYTLSTINRDQGMLARLAVVPSHQNRGIGSALLADVLGYLDRAGARDTLLYTQEENRRSQALYERYGFGRVPGMACFLSFGSGTSPGTGE